MKDGPNIARIAALIGDPARADILTALMADRALTATELAGIAGVTKQTVSAHLAKLVDARLIEVAANPELTVTYERTVKQLLLMRRRGLVQARNIRVSNTEHRRIADALQARDPDAADAAMRAHVESGFRRLIDTA